MTHEADPSGPLPEPVRDSEAGVELLALCADDTMRPEHLVDLLSQPGDSMGVPRRRVLEVAAVEDLVDVLRGRPGEFGEVLAVVISESRFDAARAALPDYHGSWVVLVDPSSPPLPIDAAEGVHCIRVHTMFCSALPMLVDTVLRHRSGERRLETALSRMRWQADRLLDAERVAQVGSWVWEIEEDSLWVSAEFRRIRGEEPVSSTVPIETCLDALPAEERERLVAFLDKLRRDGGGAGIEYHFVRPDGGLRFLRCEAQAEVGADDQVVRLVGTEQDITDRRRSERALREREEFLRLALQTARVAAWRWDVALGGASLSAGAYALLGMPEQSGDCVSLGDWLQCVHPGDRSEVFRSLRMLLREGRPIRIVHRLRKDAARAVREERWIEIAGGARSSGTGQEFSLTGTIRDVTEQRRDELERLELQNELRHAAKMEAVGRLAAGAAHDFNNVLTSILGHAQLGRLALSGDAAAESPVRTHLDAVEAACRRATALTRQLLTIGRREPPGTERIDVHAALAEHEPMLRRLVRSDIAIAVTTRAESSAVAVDRARFDQILMNLVVNACDAMPEGGRLEISTELVDVPPSKAGASAGVLRSGAFFRLGVSDSGVGISEADRERVFEPFFTTKERDKGTGLGLSIILGIVEQAGGFVTLDSEVGAGTRFGVHLPLVGGNAGESMVQRRASSTVVRGGSETLLLCEDEPEVRESLASLLRSQGYKVLEAADGQHALELVSGLRKPPELLVSDVMLTGMNGQELGQQLRAEHPQMRILFMSGYGLEQLASMGAELAGADLLRKPFGGADLLHRVRALLDAGVPTS